MSKETTGKNPTRLEMLASEYQSCIVNVHNLIYRFGGDEDVMATLICMMEVLDATIDGLKRRYSMVYGSDCSEAIDFIAATIRKIANKNN